MRRLLRTLVILASSLQVVEGYQQYSSSYSNYNKNSGYSNGNYNDDFYAAALKRTVCDGSVVQVKSMSVSCDSPYTFYYGNGANRNSPLCDYGDKATFTIKFAVVDEIEEVGDFYMTMAVYDPEGRLLVASQPEYVCQSYVGYECTNAGTYSFTKKVKFDYSDANNSKFVPYVQMAFSTSANSGYNLGAVNTNCKKWDQNSQGFLEWSAGSRQRENEFGVKYGMLLASGFAVAGMVAFVWHQSRDRTEPYWEENPQKMDLMID
jgi:hypothetical protein